jgi:MFS family permease
MSDGAVVMRCAVHSGRAAHDECPVCGRPRCDEDVRELGERGCAACVVNQAPRRVASPTTAIVAAAAPVIPIAAIGGWIYSQYVEVHIFSWLVPALLGVAGSSASSALSQRLSPSERRRINFVAVTLGAVAAVLGTAFGFRLFPHGPHDPLHPWNEVGLPYLSAVIAAVIWPLVLGPPRRSESSLLAG